MNHLRQARSESPWAILFYFGGIGAIQPVAHVAVWSSSWSHPQPTCGYCAKLMDTFQAQSESNHFVQVQPMCNPKTSSQHPQRLNVGWAASLGFLCWGPPPARGRPGPAAWRLCFTFVAQQLLVSANILIMFDHVTFGCAGRSEAKVALWLHRAP